MQMVLNAKVSQPLFGFRMEVFIERQNANIEVLQILPTSSTSVITYSW